MPPGQTLEGISYYVGINAERYGGGICVTKSRKGMIFADYPDVVNVEQMCSMLGGIGKKTAYDLLRNGDIRHIKLGKSFKIPKVCVIEYLIGDTQKVSP
jgi:DNA binding domain, excisionase family